MTVEEIKKIKKDVEDSGQYLPPRKSVVDGKFYFFFIHKKNVLDSMWMQCENEGELQRIHDIWYDRAPGCVH